MTWYIAAIVVGYTLGSIPFGLLITRIAGLGDIRSIGSGNIGATNVLRTGRKDLAFATLLLDSLKAGLAYFAFAAASGDRNIGLIAGAVAFLGHCYPVWLKFKGGKGVATYAGLLLFSFWWKVFLVGAIVWGSLFAISRISSLSALTAAIVVPVAAVSFGEPRFGIVVILALSILVFWTHRENIGRLLRGEEPKFGQKKQSQ